MNSCFPNPFHDTGLKLENFWCFQVVMKETNNNSEAATGRVQ